MSSQSSRLARQYERDGERAMYFGNDALALDLYLKALALRRETQNLFAQEEDLQIIAALQWRLGRPLEALHSYEELLKVDETVNWPDVRAGALNDMAAIENELGMHEQAKAHLQASLEINDHQLHNLGLKAICLVNLGNAQNALGELDDARDGYEAAWRLCSSLPRNQVVDVQIGVHIGRGHNSSLRGQYDAARSHFESALHECERNNRRDREIGVLENLGNLEMRLGNFAEAKDYYTSALDHCPNDPLGQRHMAGLYSSLALAEMRLGDVSKAVGDVSIDPAEKETHYNKSRGHFGRSLEHFEAADRLHQQIGDTVRQARNLINRSFLDRRALDFATAQNRLAEALRISVSTKNTLLTAQAKFNLVITLADQELFPQAQALCHETLKLIKDLGLQHTDLAINAHALMGHLLMIDGQDAEAYDSLSKAIAQIEAWRIGITRETDRLALADYKSDAYQWMIEVCHQLGRADPEKRRETCYFMERARGRALLDQLAHLYDKMEKSAPQYAYLRRGGPITYQDLQDTVDDLDTMVALVEFYTLPNKIIIFVLRSQERGPVVTQSPISEDQLWRHIQNYRREVVEHRQRGDMGLRWQELARLLLAKVISHLDGVELVYLVPHGLLHYLPLHALRLNGKYLIEHFPIAYTPSAAVLSQVIQGRAAMGRTGKPEALVVGNPTNDLPHSEDEARQIGQLFEIQPYLKESATKATIQSKLADKDVVHLACHGRFYPTQPLQSGVVFASEERLTAQEIMNSSLRTDLFTLSACETARGKIGAGDEVVGLTWALLYAGASSALVSLWAVEDESTGQLMSDFYRRLYDDKGRKVKAKAVALQEAMLELRKTKEHPYYWAPFILVGDWR